MSIAWVTNWDPTTKLICHYYIINQNDVVNQCNGDVSVLVPHLGHLAVFYRNLHKDKYAVYHLTINDISKRCVLIYIEVKGNIF